VIIYELLNKPKRVNVSLLDSCILFAYDYLKLSCVDFFILDFAEMSDLYGYCIYDDEEPVITISDSLDQQDMITTIFHELVHLAQYGSGRRKELDCDPIWEIEAYALEQKMSKLYLEGV